MSEPTEVALDTDMETAAAVVVAALLAAVAMLWQLLLIFIGVVVVVDVSIDFFTQSSSLPTHPNQFPVKCCVQLLGPNGYRPTKPTDTDKTV